MSSPTGSILSVAIVGCGIIGINHARAIARHPDLEIVALVDSVVEATVALADLVEAELGSKRPKEFVALGDLYASGGVDIVVICTPSGLHVQLAEEALAGGSHVVIEKPLDVSLPRARRLLALAEEAEARGQVVSVISQHRFDPASVVVATAAHEGGFGRLTSGVASVAWWRSQEYYDSGQWRGTWELDGGGAVMNQGVHTVDLLVWFLGRPVEIFAQTALRAHDRIEVEDVAVATIRFESGALGVIHATTAAAPGLTVRIQLHGSAGSAIIDDDKLAYFSTGGDDIAADTVPAEELAGAERTAEGFAIGHFRQYADVVNAIHGAGAPGVSVADAFLSLAVVRAMYASATLGAPVSFDAVLAGDYDDLEIVTGGAR